MNGSARPNMFGGAITRLLNQRTGRVIARRWLVWCAKRTYRQYSGTLHIWVLCRELPSDGTQATLQTAVCAHLKDVVVAVTFVPHASICFFQILVLPAGPVSPAKYRSIGSGYFGRSAT